MLKETKYIAEIVGILSLLLQAVFLIIGKWNYTVLLGNLWGGVAAIINFFAMGITLQKAVTLDEKKAADTMKLSQQLRQIAMLVIAIIGVLLPCCNLFAVLIPLFFPGIAVKLRPLIDKKYGGNQ